MSGSHALQNSGNHSGRYAWTRVKSNRHKVNKQRDVSDEHLSGRLSLLLLDLDEIDGRFPKITEGIEAEIKLIEQEISMRARGTSKPTPAPAPEAPFEVEDFESLADLEHTQMMEVDVEES